MKILNVRPVLESIFFTNPNYQKTIKIQLHNNIYLNFDLFLDNNVLNHICRLEIKGQGYILDDIDFDNLDEAIEKASSLYTSQCP